jgi:Arc/MetJ-type ribon-helix-helix transcriptional regulator
MSDLVTFSFRLPRELAAEFESAAKRLGLSRSDYVRRALEQLQEQTMQQRMADLSRQLAAQSAAAAHSMEEAESDGLV